MLKIFKNLLLQNQKSYDLETWHWHWGLRFYKDYINEDLGLTFTHFTARSNWVSNTFEWVKVLQSHLMGKRCISGAAYVIPWPLFVNQGFFLLTFKVKVKGFSFRIHGTNHYVMIFGRYSVNIRSKPVHIERRYFTAIFNENFK